MGRERNPRHGSMSVWPRKRARRMHARIRSWISIKDAKPVGFAGYKVGMTHLIATDNRQFSKTKGQNVFMPATIIECPPLRVIGAHVYQQDAYGVHLSSSAVAPGSKFLSRSIPAPKKDTSGNLANLNLSAGNYTNIRLVVQTQPDLVGFGKKKPEVFELGLGGNLNDQLNFAKQHLGKELTVNQIFSEGQQLDAHAITKGKGFQGPVKRFGVTLRSHKSEKTRRGPGAMGGWRGQGHTHYRIAKAGQMGYHQRLDMNKHLLRIDANPQNINALGGFKHYGVVKNPYILLKGSLPGPAKRLIKLTLAGRPAKNIPTQAPAISYVSTTSHQGKT